MERLPEHVWIDVFNLLSSKDIENAANSCENWRNIIATTPLLMRKLTLRIDFWNVEERPWMKLPYQNLCLKHFNYTPRHKIDKFLKDIDQLTAVKKINIFDLNFVDVIEILNKFQNLTTLIAKQSGWGKQDDTKIDLPNLTHLKIDSNPNWLLPKIRLHKIEILFVCDEQGCWTEDDVKNFGSFLQTCDKLKHFTLIGFYTNEFLKIKSQLETFEIIGNCGTLPSSFLRFLKYQKSSLKNLTLDVYGFDDEIANFIYFEMNLDKLVDRRRRHRGQIQKLKKVSVKNLTINSDDDNFEYFEKLFQCCEMLEVLDVILPRTNPLKFIVLLSKLPKLKHLKISSNCSKPDEFQQPKIKLLKPHGYSKERFEATFKFNRLERLILSENFKTPQCVKIIRCCPNLTHVEMHDINLTKNDFENIFQDCNKIQEIYLHSRNREFTDEDVQTFKDVGSKIKLKVKTNKDVIEKFKLYDAKNRLTVVDQNFNYEIYDSFEVSPRILSHYSERSTK